MLEKLKTSKKAVGMKQTIKCIENKSAEVVFIARDSDEWIVSKIEELCRTNGVKVVYIDSMKQLGKECGIQVGASTACILKERNP